MFLSFIVHENEIKHFFFKCSTKFFVPSFWDLVLPSKIHTTTFCPGSLMQSRARFSCITIDFANFLLTTFTNLILQIQLCIECYRKTIHNINIKWLSRPSALHYPVRIRSPNNFFCWMCLGRFDWALSLTVICNCQVISLCLELNKLRPTVPVKFQRWSPRLVTLTVFRAHSSPPLPSLPILDILEKFSVLYHLKFTKEKVIDILSLNNIYRKK